jgi:hypothetical protein
LCSSGSRPSAAWRVHLQRRFQGAGRQPRLGGQFGRRLAHPCRLQLEDVRRGGDPAGLLETLLVENEERPVVLLEEGGLTDPSGVGVLVDEPLAAGVDHDHADQVLRIHVVVPSPRGKRAGA